jgi:hypothetical protein
VCFEIKNIFFYFVKLSCLRATKLELYLGSWKFKRRRIGSRSELELFCWTVYVRAILMHAFVIRLRVQCYDFRNIFAEKIGSFDAKCCFCASLKKNANFLGRKLAKIVIIIM